ncbi:MAG: PAS domain-containing protein [Gemmatimonadaceae bacterium]
MSGTPLVEDSAATLFAGRGEMHARCRAMDWAATPLGPVSGWSLSLRTIAGTVLASRNPMFLFWGPQLVQIYNDAFRPSLGEGGRHPRALGMRGRESWTEIWPTIGPQIEQVMTTGEATWHEDQYLPIERNGRLDDVWWTYSYSPVRDDDGSINGTLVVCQETTLRILGERERDRLRWETLRAEEHAAQVLEQVADAYVAMDEHFVILAANAATERALGVSRHTLIGRSHWEAFPAFAGTEVERQYRRVQEERIHVHFTHHFVQGEHDIHLAIDAYPTDDRGVVLFWRDVSEARAAAAERERLLRALEVERSRLAYVFQHAPAFLAVLRGPQLVFELANDAYYQLIGHRELVGKPLFEALPELRGQGFEDLLRHVVESGEPFVGRELAILVARTPDAPPEARFLDFAYLPLVEADGTRAGVIAHGIDVTEQVHARKEIERLYNMEQQARATVEEAYRIAESANRAKAEFLAVMSHELRTPLNAIGGYAELMEMGIRGPVSAEQRVDLRRIQTSQRHLLGLINEVLNYAKLETGMVRYYIADVSLRESVGAAESLVAPQAQTNGLALTVALCSPTLAARADAEKLRQILVNLLSNAVKFTPAGGRIEVTCAAADDMVSVRVSDTGIGIPADKLEAIFDPFVQVRADLTRPHEGTGLGLAISRDLARGMDGDLTVESRVGEGSTFSLTLPRVADLLPEVA